MTSSNDMEYFVQTLDHLQSLFGQPSEASLKKEVAFVHPSYRPLIESSPFAILTTTGPQGLDASPRGDAPGFVQIADEHTLLLPERRGNNRIDSLRNLLTDPRAALLFLIPGVGETLRVSGKAHISIAPALLKQFEVEGRLPHCVIVLKVERVFFQCARAIIRSKLWDAASQSADRPVPTVGAMLAAMTNSAIDGDRYDRELPERQRTTLY